MKSNSEKFPIIHELLVYKCVEKGKSHWLIYQFDEKTKKQEYIGIIPFGRIVYIYLNKIKDIKMNQESNIDFINIDVYDDLNDRVIVEVPKIDFNDVDYKDWLAFSTSLTEMINSKDDLIITRNELFEDYERTKYFAYIYTNRKLFDHDILDEIIESDNAIEFRDYTSIVKILGCRCLENGLIYTLFSVEDYETLFMLDLWEVLFNTDVTLKFKMCNDCGSCFECNDNRTRYCPDCRTEKRTGVRRYNQRNNKPIARLRKLIQDYLGQKLNWALNKQRYDEKSELVLRIRQQLTDFHNEVYYYLDLLNGNEQVYNSKYDNSIDTYEKLEKWLENYYAKIKKMNWRE